MLCQYRSDTKTGRYCYIQPDNVQPDIAMTLCLLKENIHDDISLFLTARLQATGPTLTELSPAVISPPGRRRVVAVSHSHLHSLTTGPDTGGPVTPG